MALDIDDADLASLAEVLARFRAAIDDYERLAVMVETALRNRHGDRSAGPPPSEAEPPANVFNRAGDVWTIVYAGSTIQLSDAKGLHDLRHLLSSPNEPIHVLELLGRPGCVTGADPILDHRAKAAYRARLTELELEIEDAADRRDLARAETARCERDSLVDELARATGLGGRDRRLGDETERARKAVWARIRHAIARIARRHPDLGDHLTLTVSTGVYCSYQPPGPVEWR